MILQKNISNVFIIDRNNRGIANSKTCGVVATSPIRQSHVVYLLEPKKRATYDAVVPSSFEMYSTDYLLHWEM